VPGIREVFHAHLVDYAYPSHCHETWAVLIVDGATARFLSVSGAKFVYVLDPDRPEGRTWDNAGRAEDVATGSAAGPAAGYLLHHGVRPAGEPLLVHQGRFTGRPSTIEVRPGPDGRLWVGGPVAPVAAGRFQAHLT